MSPQFKINVSLYAECLTGQSHQTVLEEVREDGELIGVMLRQSSEGGELEGDADVDDLVYLPLEVLGDIGAAIYEILEKR